MKLRTICLLILFFNIKANALDLTVICRNALNKHFLKSCSIQDTTQDTTLKSKPLFVTLRKEGQTRGCAGTFQTRFSTLHEELAYFSVSAATVDFRYPAINSAELKDISIIITFPGELRPVESLSDYNPWKHGLLVRKNGKEGVILPCEAKTENYAIEKAISHAGIDSINNADIYIFDCETIKEQSL